MSRQAIRNLQPGGGGDIVKLQAQLDIEKKGRKDAEEKNKYLVSKIDVLQQRIADKNDELEKEKEEKEEVLKSKQSLEQTIERLEHYLRNKAPRFDVKTAIYEPYTDPETPRDLRLANMVKTDSELEEKCRQLKKEKSINEVLEKRVQILENLLKENNISINTSELDKLDSQITNSELDF